MSSPRLPLLGVALAAIAGILVAEHFHPSPLALAIVTISALAFSFLRGGTATVLIATAGTFALAHVWQWNNNPDRAWAEAIAAAPRHATVEGVLIDEPQSSTPGQWRARLRVERWDFGAETIKRPADISVRWRSEEAARYGDKWRITGQLAPFATPRNP